MIVTTRYSDPWPLLLSLPHCLDVCSYLSRDTFTCIGDTFTSFLTFKSQKKFNSWTEVKFWSLQNFRLSMMDKQVFYLRRNIKWTELERAEFDIHWTVQYLTRYAILSWDVLNSFHVGGLFCIQLEVIVSDRFGSWSSVCLWCWQMSDIYIE